MLYNRVIHNNNLIGDDFMFYVISVLSYIIYSILVVTLFVTGLVSSLSSGHALVSTLKIVVIIFLLYEIFVEWKIYLYPKKASLIQRRLSKHDLLIFFSVFFGALFSYLTNYNFALGAVVASSLIGLIGGLLIPTLAIPIYCGSFAGMVSSLLVSDPFFVIVIGLFAGLLYVAGSETFKGFGGKLGATAYFATLLASICFNTIGDTMIGGPVTIQYDVFIVFIIGSLGTYFINARYKIGVVVASALLGLTFGLILPNVFDNGNSLAVALFCGTFIGMSTTTKLTTRVSVAIASMIGTIVFLYTTPYFAGLGGKLGLIAFGSSITTAGIYNLKSHLFKHHD
jgi:hypothetical protein